MAMYKLIVGLVRRNYYCAVCVSRPTLHTAFSYISCPGSKVQNVALVQQERPVGLQMYIARFKRCIKNVISYNIQTSKVSF